MNASAFRYLYDYHFAENRKLWDETITALSAEKFIQPCEYAMGSVRAQLLRLLHDLGVPTSSQDFIFYVYAHGEQ